MVIAFVGALLAKILQGIRAPHFARDSQMARIPTLLVARTVHVPDILHAVQALRPIFPVPLVRSGISKPVRTGILTGATSIIRAAILIRIVGLRIAPSPTEAFIMPEPMAATETLLFKASIVYKHIRLADPGFDTLVLRSSTQGNRWHYQTKEKANKWEPEAQGARCS